MSKPLTVRVVTFKEGDVFVAQALDVDVAAQGRTLEEANRRLMVVMRAEEEAAKANGRSLLDIGPAPHPFHVLYANDGGVRSETQVA